MTETATEVENTTTSPTEPGTDTASKKSNRPRNYSHLERNPETLDEIKGGDGQMYKIPCTMGSTYWGVLVAMYENVNKPVYIDALVKRVDEIMRDHDEQHWEMFCNKDKTTVWKRVKGQRNIQKIKSWKDRVINNAKTLTRYKDYGLRLYERGHIMRYEYDAQDKPYFILYTNLDCLKVKTGE